MGGGLQNAADGAPGSNAASMDRDEGENHQGEKLLRSNIELVGSKNLKRKRGWKKAN